MVGKESMLEEREGEEREQDGIGRETEIREEEEEREGRKRGVGRETEITEWKREKGEREGVEEREKRGGREMDKES